MNLSPMKTLSYLQQEIKKILYVYDSGYSTGEYKMPSTVEEIKIMPFGDAESEKGLYRKQCGGDTGLCFRSVRNWKKVAFSYSFLRRIGVKALPDVSNLGNTEFLCPYPYIHDTAFDSCQQAGFAGKPVLMGRSMSQRG